eukprot:SAG31_NODE_1045_length_10180_cov_5.454221_11_plen_424_part_00
MTRRRVAAAAAASLAGLYAIWYRKCCVKSPELHVGPNATFNRRVIERVPSLTSEYWPTWWLPSAHLQAIAYVLYLRTRTLSGLAPLRQQWLTMRDGGDVLLEWVDHSVTTGQPLPHCAPVCILLHGIGGNTNAMADFMHALSRRGFRSVCMVRRGHHPNRPIRKEAPAVSVFGNVADLQEVVAAAGRAYPAAKLTIVGLSAGSALVVRYLGECRDATPVAAAAALSPGYDLRECFKRVQAPYEQYLAKSLKQFFLRNHQAALTGSHRSDECNAAYAAALAAPTLHKLLVHMAPLAGYDNFDAYLEGNNPIGVAEHIQIPILVINALDDPICIAQNVRENLWLKDRIGRGILAVTDQGSHCAFFHGTAAALWQVETTVNYLQAALAVVKDDEELIDQQHATMTIKGKRRAFGWTQMQRAALRRS